MSLTKEQLLAELEDLLRTMPSSTTVRRNVEALDWLGRATTLVEKWDPIKAIGFRRNVDRIRSWHDQTATEAADGLITTLHQARHDLRLETLGPVSISLGHGMVFDYFDELRKIIEEAKQDLLFVDPYLDAEFVSRYLGHTTDGVTVRLLTQKKLQTLLPAVDAFSQQSKLKVEVRSVPNLHDRYVFVDRSACYQSGASFKDGAKSAPTTLTQIIDAFAPMLQTYETFWKQSQIHR